jgi:hypothetical protein
MALGAHVHCGSAAKEATVVNAKDWALRLLAASLLVFHDECKLHIIKQSKGQIEISYCKLGLEEGKESFGPMFVSSSVSNSH